MSAGDTSRGQRSGLAWPNFPLGFGTGRLCSPNGGLRVSVAASLLREAHDLGIRFVDTAPVYGQGQAETAIGLLPNSVRHGLIICSKVGYTFGRKGVLLNLAKPILRPALAWIGGLRDAAVVARERAGSSRGSLVQEIAPDVIRSGLEGSLRRMRRDVLDILLLHDPSAEAVDDACNRETLDELVRTGRVRSWGVSTSDPIVAERAALARCDVLQIPVHRRWIDAAPDSLRHAPGTA